MLRKRPGFSYAVYLAISGGCADAESSTYTPLLFATAAGKLSFFGLHSVPSLRSSVRQSAYQTTNTLHSTARRILPPQSGRADRQAGGQEIRDRRWRERNPTPLYPQTSCTRTHTRTLYLSLSLSLVHDCMPLAPLSLFSPHAQSRNATGDAVELLFSHTPSDLDR